MYSCVNAMALRGIEGQIIQVECDVSPGLPEISMVGYLGAEVKEAKERVRTAMKNTGLSLPPKKITINLAPADIRKEGTAFDLAIGTALLSAGGLLPDIGLEDKVFIGELGLDGRLVPVNGILNMVSAARDAGFRYCLLPEDNLAEGSLVEGIAVCGVRSIGQLPELLKQPLKPEPSRLKEFLREKTQENQVDFSEVSGQMVMRRAAEIAAAGMHNLLFIGTPGSGKTMIARRIPTILPSITWEESLEVSKIYSVCGMLCRESPLIWNRPFRSPHHTVSAAALVGGGRVPRPGEISLADRGVLFLDELPEFQKSTLEVLRQPLEDREVHIARAQGAYEFPADMMLVAAMNPCRCGFYPDRSRCHCSEAEVASYLKRISRPLLDRMDICVEAPPLQYKDLTGGKGGESSASIRKRVEAARNIQEMRLAGRSIHFNSQMKAGDIKEFCRLTEQQKKMMEELFVDKGLSARAYHRILRVSRTIADLAGSEEIQDEHLAEAVMYRGPEEKFWR